MTEQEAYENVKRIARNLSFTVKLMPFVGVVAYIICGLIAYYVSPTVQEELDMAFYASPMYVVISLILSKQAKLCKWHKLECIMPLLPRTLVEIDKLLGLNELQARGGIAFCVFMFILTLINAYFTFWRKTPPQRN